MPQMGFAVGTERFGGMLCRGIRKTKVGSILRDPIAKRVHGGCAENSYLPLTSRQA